MIQSIVVSLLLTLLIESILSLLIGVRSEDNIYQILVINIVTNPVVVTTTNLTIILFHCVPVTNIVIAILEISVVFIEGLWFKKKLETVKINPYLFSLYLNGISFSTGIIINIIQ